MKAKIRLKQYNNTEIKISGSKNSSLPIIAASILCDEVVILRNIPNISDVNILLDILKKMGYKFEYSNNTLIVFPTIIKQKVFNYKKINKLRGSYYLIGSLIGKYELSNFSFLTPGGCKLGVRPINYHLNAFKNMGLTITTTDCLVNILGTKRNTIHNLDYPSVGATINIILASSKLEKETVITNASIEPEVIDVCEFLKSMGVSISINERTIKIIGKKYLHSTEYNVMEDRIEAGTFLILGAIHKGITIKNVNPKNLEYLTSLLINCGYTLTINNDHIILHNPEKENLKPFSIILSPHPGFPTDLGPLISVLASQINGESYIIETVFKDRFSHVYELLKMNISINQINNKIIIKGKNNIKNSTVKASDLRCAATLMLAGSLNSNFTIIENIDYLFRGYENIKEKLNSLGIEFIV